MKGFFYFSKKKGFKRIFFCFFDQKTEIGFFFSTLRYLRIWRETAKNRIFFLRFKQASRPVSRLATSLFFGRRPTKKKKGRQKAPFWVIWTLKWRFWSQKFRRFWGRNFRVEIFGSKSDNRIFFHDLTHLRRARFRHENKIFFPALRHLAEILKGFFFQL